MRSGFLAHTEPVEALEAHLLTVARRAAARAQEVPVDGLVSGATLARLGFILGATHDLGKATPHFQRHLREGRPGRPPRQARHAPLSAVLGALWVEAEVDGLDLPPDLARLAAPACFQVIRRHHGELAATLEDCVLLEDERALLADQWASIAAARLAVVLAEIGYPWTVAETGRRLREFLAASHDLRWRAAVRAVTAAGTLRPFLFVNLLACLLLEADRLVTATLRTGTPWPARRALPVHALEVYRQRQGWTCPQTPLDALRERLYQAVQAQAQALPPEHRLLTLTAPTGLGKTVAGLAVALTLRQRREAAGSPPPRLIYTLPFLSIIDQTHRLLRRIFPGADSGVVLAHHHLAEAVYHQDGEDLADDLGLLLIEGWASEITVTTFVQLFRTLLPRSEAPLRRFGHLAGAVVILDEVQAIPVRFWPLFRALARSLAEATGTVFLLMTATRPLIFSPEEAVELVPDRLFPEPDRTVMEVWPDPLTPADLIRRIRAEIDRSPQERVIVILNTHAAAETVFAALVADAPGTHDLVYLSARVAPIERRRRLERLRTTRRPFLLVCTPVIEAGVDLDADRVYRELAPLDSLIQAAGRCNRHGRPGQGRVVVFSLAGETGSPAHPERVYDPVLLAATRDVLGTARAFREPEYAALARAYFAEVTARMDGTDGRRVLDAAARLDYPTLGTFSLLEEDDEVPVFLAMEPAALAVLDAYTAALRHPDPRERRRRLRRLRPAMAAYLISLPRRTVTLQTLHGRLRTGEGLEVLVPILERYKPFMVG